MPQTRSQLKQSIINTILDDLNRQNTAEIVRERLFEIIDNSFNLADDDFEDIEGGFTEGSGIDITNGVISLDIENYTQNIIQLTGTSYLGLSGGNTEISSDTNLSLYALNGQIFGQASGDVAFNAQSGTVSLTGEYINFGSSNDVSIYGLGAAAWLEMIGSNVSLGYLSSYINFNDQGELYITAPTKIDIFGADDLVLSANNLITVASPLQFVNVVNFDSLTANTILEIDGSKDVVSATKGTAYNKNFGTTSDTVCEGNDSRLTPQNRISNPYFFDDFHSIGFWTAMNNSGVQSATIAAEVGEKGVVQFGSSATNGTGRGYRHFNLSSIRLQSDFEWIWKIRTGALSTAADEYVLVAGLNDVEFSEGTDGIYIKYDRANHGDVWVAVNRSNSVETKTVSAVSVTANTQWYLRAVYNHSLGEIKFYVASGAGGSWQLIATHTTNIPNTAGRETGAMIYISKTAGSSVSRVAVIDYYFETTNISR
jgi:hypothetical protein